MVGKKVTRKSKSPTKSRKKTTGTAATSTENGTDDAPPPPPSAASRSAIAPYLIAPAIVAVLAALVSVYLAENNGGGGPSGGGRVDVDGGNAVTSQQQQQQQQQGVTKEGQEDALGLETAELQCPENDNNCLNAKKGLKISATDMRVDLGKARKRSIAVFDPADGTTPLDVGVEQTVGAVQTGMVLDVIDKAERYMKELVVKPEYDAIKGGCRNKDAKCAFWASQGYCDDSFEYMLSTCAPICRMCELLDPKVRCAPPPDLRSKDTLLPHDLHAVFERLADLDGATVLSRPSADGGPLEGGPWVVTLEDFLSEKECDRLVELGHREPGGYQRSMGQDDSKDGYVAKDRTSTNTWCMGDCYSDPATQKVLSRIEGVTGIPATNQEYLQLLRYEKTQFYGVHHDYIPGHYGSKVLSGPRILTFYLYLSDVQAGGGTHFNRLNLTVTPKKGRAVVWPNVMDSNLDLKDIRTEHEALPVEEGIKYGANAWVHLRDFKTPSARVCV